MAKTHAVPKVFVRSAYNYDVDAASKAAAFICEGPDMAIQSAKEETDINTIVNRFMNTGMLPNPVRAPQYGDFTGATDYRTSLDAVMAAQASFMELPAHVRRRFHNDPQAFLEFVADEDNRAEAIKLGLVFPPPPPVADSAKPEDSALLKDAKPAGDKPA